MSLDRMILGSVKCVRCGAGYGNCDCWEKCRCGWSHGRGEPCHNPNCGGTGERQVVATTKPKRKR